MSQVTLLHVHNRAMGYGRAGVDLCADLRAQGVTVFDSQGNEPGVKMSTEDRRVAEGLMAPPSPTRAICWVSVPTHARWWYEGQHATILTMWEASNLPEAFRETLHEFDLVLVPSWHNVELFSNYHPDVRFLPLGVRADQWHYHKRPPIESTFRFLIGGSGPRKGTDLAYRAFRTVFPKPKSLDPEPVLVMKNPKGEEFYGTNVEMVAGRLSDDEEVALYESCHAYLQPSRGEGFGLQPLQAIAQGMPTVLTNAHGHESFAHLGIPIGYSWSDADYFIYGEAGKWWEPDFEQLCEAMWDVYHNYEPHRVKAAHAAEIVADQWTTADTAYAFRETLGSLLDEPGPPLSAPVRIPEQKLYLVRVERAQRNDIGGTVHLFEPGRDYYEPADVKRILFESGNLHPSCLASTQIGDEAGLIDIGLSPRQLGAIEDYSSAHAYCPTCSQRLNTQPTKADDIEAEMEAAAG